VGYSAAVATPYGPLAPAVDHHQHLFSPATARLISVEAVDAGALIGHLDDAGIARAVVLSVAYTFGSPNRTVEREYDQVRATNDWTSRQVEAYPDRLRGFGGLNPLRDYALEELARCAQDPHLRFGLKLHFGNSVVDYHDRQHLAQVQRVFRAANGYGMAIVVHMRASISRRLPYGRDEARIFVEELLPTAPDVPVQIAHLAGAGGYLADPPVDQALAVFVEAIANRDPRTRLLLFDVTDAVNPTAPPEELALIARRIRGLGVERVLYGSDGPGPGHTPREGWAAFRRLPLSEGEFRTIAGAVAPYMR
jgi:predicted TIM-barrel fold metal-dependent hydrolase